jgi:transposase
VAAVAQSHGLNANLVHKWRRGRGMGAVQAAARVLGPVEPTPGFVALSLPAPSSTPYALPDAAAPAAAPADKDIRMELKRGALGVSVTWPISGASECAAWLRELLR